MIPDAAGYVYRHHSVDLAVLRLRRAAPDAAGASPHGADRRHDRRGQPAERRVELRLGVRPSRLPGARRARLRVGDDGEPLVHGGPAARARVARRAPLPRAPRAEPARPAAARADAAARLADRRADGARGRRVRRRRAADGLARRRPGRRASSRPEPRVAHVHGAARRVRRGRRDRRARRGARPTSRPCAARPGPRSSSERGSWRAWRCC